MQQNQILIANRIASARKQLGFKQEQLSELIGFKDRQILSNIETGKRVVSADELIKIMQVTGKELGFFTDSFTIAGEGSFSFRAKADSDALSKFQNYAEKLIGTYRKLSELENISFSFFSKKLRINENSSYEDAKAAGENLADELELGTIPAQNLLHKLEEELDILLLFLDTQQDISGAACHLQSFDTILINRNEHIGRINYDISHELFHLLTWSAMKPNKIDNRFDQNHRPRCEQLADNFASAFLMPEKYLKREWENRKRLEINKRLNSTATLFNVSAKALKWRIINLGWLTDDQISKIADNLLTANGEPKKHKKKIPLFSDKFIKRLYEGLNNGHISARRAATLTELSLGKLLQIFKDYNLEPPFEL